MDDDPKVIRFRATLNKRREAANEERRRIELEADLIPVLSQAIRTMRDKGAGAEDVIRLLLQAVAELRKASE